MVIALSSRATTLPLMEAPAVGSIVSPRARTVVRNKGAAIIMPSIARKAMRRRIRRRRDLFVIEPSCQSSLIGCHGLVLQAVVGSRSKTRSTSHAYHGLEYQAVAPIPLPHDFLVC